MCTFIYTDGRHRLRCTRDGVDAPVEGCLVNDADSCHVRHRGGGGKTVALYKYEIYGLLDQICAVTVDAHGCAKATSIYKTLPNVITSSPNFAEFRGRVYDVGLSDITDLTTGAVIPYSTDRWFARDSHVEAADGNLYFASYPSYGECVKARFDGPCWQTINMCAGVDENADGRLCQGSSGLIYARYDRDMWSRDVRAPTPELKLGNDARLNYVYWATIDETIVVHSAYAREFAPALMYDERNNDFCGAPFLMTASMVPISHGHCRGDR